MRSTLGVPRGLGPFLRRRGWLAALVAVIATVGAAQAATATKLYHVNIADTTAVAGTTATYTLTLANSTGSTHSLGSANVEIPTDEGFTVTAPALGASIAVTASDDVEQWTVTHAATPSGPVLQFRAGSSHDAIEPGETVSADVEVEASCDAETATWVTQAKQANSFSGPPGNDFTRDAADPVLTISGGGTTPVGLEFTSQPTRTETDEAIDPAVTVTAIDACDNVVTPASGNVSIEIGDDPSDGAASLAGQLSQPLDGGVAEFDDLSIDVSGEDYTLVAALGALSAESAKFDVVDEICTSSSTSCFVQNGDTRVEVPVPPAGATMALSLGSPKNATSPCGGGGDAVGSWATIDPAGYPSSQTIPVTLTYDKLVAPGTGVANFIVCLGKPDEDDPDTIVWTRLLDCGRSAKQSVPCISKRNRTGVGDLVIELLIKSEDPVGGTFG